MKLDPRAQADLRGHVPRLLSLARARLKLPPGPEETLASSELARAARIVSELHQGLVGERPLARASTYERAALLGAYLLWWWPQSYARVRAALSLAPLPFALQGRTASVRILDLGAGPGPAALAIADWLAARGLDCEALLVDESEAALAEAKALAAHRPHLSLRTQRLDLAPHVERAALATSLRWAPLRLGEPALPPRGFELISAAHLLNELPGAPPERARFLRELCGAQLAEQGVLLLLEPALRETGRALLEVRDRLIAAPEKPAGEDGENAASPLPERLRALAPCLTQARCPALANPRDWCTAEVEWSAPPHLLQLSKELGLHAEAPLSFAPMLLAREVPAPRENLWRVVGVPPEEKGKKRLFVCAGRGRLPVARLDRDARADNAAFDEARRGDLLRFANLAEKGDGLRLVADATVEAVEPGAMNEAAAPGEASALIAAGEAAAASDAGR